LFSKELVRFHPPLFPLILSTAHGVLPPKMACQLTGFLFGLLGISIPDTIIEEILSLLGFKLTPCVMGWSVKAPSFRFDIACEEDLIEEVGRLYGYQKIPCSPLQFSYKPIVSSEQKNDERTIRERLVARGYQEVITYSFVDPVLQRKIYPQYLDLGLSNPISSEMAVMRCGLWPGLIKIMQYNQHRQQGRGRFFEIGRRFYKEPVTAEVKQEVVVGGLIYGSVFPEGWGDPLRGVDFFDIKGDLQALLALTRQGGSWEFLKQEHPALHPGQTSTILLQGREVGYIGQIHPQILSALDVTGPGFVFELELESLLYARFPEFSQIPKYPFVRRDLAVLLDEHQEVAQVLAFCKAEGAGLVRNVFIFDVYVGEKVPFGKKSVGLGFILQSLDRTLQDEEVDHVMEDMAHHLKRQFGASLRSL
jgi:phenylalanyl-tRNA synthetase beta chain